MTTTTEPAMQIWIGCLHCYYSGQLVGEWFDAIDADEVSLADVHCSAGGSLTGCEESWCSDVDDMPVHPEMSTPEVAEWVHVVGEVDEQLRPAVFAWVRSGDYVPEGIGESPSSRDFEERYEGRWEDFDASAHANGAC